jgi:hypothetical protein
LWRGDDERRAVLLVQLEHELLHVLARRRIEVARRARPRGEGAACCVSARATATRCCSPPESCPGRWTEPVLQADALEQLAGACARRRDRAPGDQAREHDVLERSEVGEQVMELEDEADLAVAKAGELGLGPREDVLTVEEELTARRLVERAEEMEERALARPPTPRRWRRARRRRPRGRARRAPGRPVGPSTYRLSSRIACTRPIAARYS